MLSALPLAPAHHASSTSAWNTRAVEAFRGSHLRCRDDGSPAQSVTVRGARALILRGFTSSDGSPGGSWPPPPPSVPRSQPLYGNGSAAPPTPAAQREQRSGKTRPRNSLATGANRRYCLPVSGDPTGIKIGYARVSTTGQDLTTQRDALAALLATVAEFEADLARARIREGMAVAKAKGRLRGKQPKLSPSRKPTSSRSGVPAGTPPSSSPSSSP